MSELGSEWVSYWQALPMIGLRSDKNQSISSQTFTTIGQWRTPQNNYWQSCEASCNIEGKIFGAGDQQEVQVGSLKYFIGTRWSFKSFFCFSKVDGTCILAQCGQGSKSSFLFRSTRTTCLQGPLVYKDLLSVRTTCPQDFLSKRTTFLQGPIVLKDQLSLRTTSPQGPLVCKDLLSTRITFLQGPLVHKDLLSTSTSCSLGPLIH